MFKKIIHAYLVGVAYGIPAKNNFFKIIIRYYYFSNSLFSGNMEIDMPSCNSLIRKMDWEGMRQFGIVGFSRFPMQYHKKKPLFSRSFNSKRSDIKCFLLSAQKIIKMIESYTYATDWENKFSKKRMFFIGMIPLNHSKDIAVEYFYFNETEMKEIVAQIRSSKIRINEKLYHGIVLFSPIHEAIKDGNELFSDEFEKLSQNEVDNMTNYDVGKIFYWRQNATNHSKEDAGVPK